MTKAHFTDIFNTHFDAVRNYIYYRSGDSILATDIAQDTFIKIWEKQLSDNKNIKGLLFKIAADIFINNYRKQKTLMQFKLQFKPEYDNETPEARIQFKELHLAYEKALAKLPEKQRVVFLMHRMDKLKYHEIADHLGLSIKAIEKRMKLAISFLRHEIDSL